MQASDSEVNAVEEGVHESKPRFRSRPRARRICRPGRGRRTRRTRSRATRSRSRAATICTPASTIRPPSSLEHVRQRGDRRERAAAGASAGDARHGDAARAGAPHRRRRCESAGLRVRREPPDSRPGRADRRRVAEPLEDDLDEADFFIQQSLFEEARAILETLLGRYPSHPLVTAKLRDLEAMERAAAARSAPPSSRRGR